MQPRRFLDELYRIVSRHPDYNAAQEPDLSPRDPWWQVAGMLLRAFRRLVDPQYSLRLIHEKEKGLSLQLNYEHERHHDFYLIDVSFLPLLRRRHRPLHDLTVSFLATLLDRTKIGDWNQYLDGGMYHEWLDEGEQQEPDRDRRRLINYYTDPKKPPARYHALLHPDRPRTTEELERLLSRLRPDGYPSPLRDLVTVMRDTLPLLDSPDISLHDLAYPLSEKELEEEFGGGYPVQPDEYLSLVWNDHRKLLYDEMHEQHLYHIESTGNEYGLWPLGGVIVCRPDEPYVIRKSDNRSFRALLGIFCRLYDCNTEIKQHFGVN